MFLDEAHRTTRNYTALKEKVGTDIFGKEHRLEPYYAASFALYRLEFLFRSTRIPNVQAGPIPPSDGCETNGGPKPVTSDELAGDAEAL